MNTRKFYLILSVLVMSFLFVSGLLLLTYWDDLSQNSMFGDILDGISSEKDPLNVLVMGGDKVNKNTDTMMLVNFNPSTVQVSVLSIPRDTKIKVKGSSVPKINSAYPIGGQKLALQTVKNLLNINVKHYVYVDTSAFRKIIDLLGGVDINIPVDMDYDDPVQNLHVHFTKGLHHLNGKEAEEYMRFRKPGNSKYTQELLKYYDGSDLKRIQAQQNFIKEVIRQKLNLYTLTKLNDVLKVIFDNVETDLTINDALKLCKNINKLSADAINMFTLPGNPRSESSGDYYIMDGAKTNEILKQYFNATGNVAVQPQTSEAPSKAKPTPKPKDGEKNVNRDNPSNPETSMEGTTNDDP